MLNKSWYASKINIKKAKNIIKLISLFVFPNRFYNCMLYNPVYNKILINYIKRSMPPKRKTETKDATKIDVLAKTD